MKKQCVYEILDMISSIEPDHFIAWLNENGFYDDYVLKEEAHDYLMQER